MILSKTLHITYVIYIKLHEDIWLEYADYWFKESRQASRSRSIYKLEGYIPNKADNIQGK